MTFLSLRFFGLINIFVPNLKHFAFTKSGMRKELLQMKMVHIRSFKCTIETRLRSFCFKVFHGAIALNNFLFKIWRKDSPNCSFYEKLSETSLYVFCDCECVKPILSDLHSFIISKLKDNIQIGNFEIMFGCPNNKFLTYVFLCTKFYFYKCKFQNQTPSFTGLKLFLRNQHDVEYRIATRKQT